MFGLTGYQSTNRNHNKTPLPSYQNAYDKKPKILNEKNQKTITLDKDIERKKPLYTTGGNIKWYSHSEKVWWFL